MSSSSSSSLTDRLETELSLLQAMYPTTLSYIPQSRELHYTSYTSTNSTSSVLTIRLPDLYPTRGVPEIIAARDGAKNDIRDVTKRSVLEVLGLADERSHGNGNGNGKSNESDESIDGDIDIDNGYQDNSGPGEVLDQIIEVFEDIVASNLQTGTGTGTGTGTSASTGASIHDGAKDNHGRPRKRGSQPRRNDGHGDDDTTDSHIGTEIDIEIEIEIENDIKNNDPQHKIRRGHHELQQRCPKTVIIWLHHLLALSKRKLAVTPTTTTTTISTTGTTMSSSSSSSPSSSNSISISGLTKPGYPGIMVFSGPKDLVDAHVRELRGLNWQAFQVRYDSDDEKEDGMGWSMARAGTTSGNTNTNTNTSATTTTADRAAEAASDHVSAATATTATGKKKADGRKDKHKHKHNHEHSNGNKYSGGSKTNNNRHEPGEWRFSHGQGKIVEVETMADVVKGIVEEENRKVFLRAVGVK
ncbi:hypothetical protein A1O1_03617 [Capronia coronata CBS 617.96]|uniref:RWD domain-containing protein n=1 Tax=Capronia coronata CBS 617.96 TaxID=1182541 RepID=W9Z7N0_9EURO|nr:uncharacterized protein A1O1_03617 [Capronia coronata CBS 617.96]EXJ90514.1 hypothetical protein A1O1_03617 [Capronia coronata CBS 617.96]